MKIFLIVLCFVSQLFAVPVTIPSGANATWVSQKLQEKGIIKSPRLFYLYLRTNKLSTQLHTGDFDIPAGGSYKDISDILIGKKQQFISVTIPEGFTINEIASRLEKKAIISSAADFLTYIQQQPSSTINPLLSKETIQSFEGILFPDTYYFSKNSSFNTVYRAFIKRFNDVFLTEYQNTSSPKLPFYDTLILASIIEKEAGTISEMPIISGVFHNRLRKRMYLASCPTVGYAMGQPRKTSLTYKDLEVKSPYNTYKNKGLPPSPIASPGKRAFKAALNPDKTPYLYFVSKNDGSGTHIFSLTLNEHLRNQKKILSKTN
ncbi:endolytic transglycosylase MltG [Candidatus Marinamargulisbacteria bacterium SCGC AG-343-K17]|nr:endolytic transglycosylase MltG [Candidatus Marinamargulisbacteria bacterium SCGC AG-343-K17]